jgi:hypothetical protein
MFNNIFKIFKKIERILIYESLVHKIYKNFIFFNKISYFSYLEVLKNIIYQSNINK